MTRITVAAVAALSLLAGGCVSRYVVINDVPRSELTVVVFTDNDYRGGTFLEQLEARGFDNSENRVQENPNPDFNVKWGAAPRAYVEEIARAVEQEFDVAPRLLHQFEPDDYDVFINLPVEPSEVPDRDAFEVTIFTDDEQRGREALTMLAGMGYTNDNNDVSDEPNDEFNIKWGAAPEAYVEEIAGFLELTYDVELARLEVFERDDDDIFINLPFNLPAATERQAFEITVFCDNHAVGREVLDLLYDLGYTNRDNEVLDTPNEDYNVKYGALPAEFVAEIAGALETRFGVEFEQLDWFESDDRDVFINIPGQ